MHDQITYPDDPRECYNLLARQLSALVEGCPLPLPALSNCAALLWQSLTDINWAGFYLACEDMLLLGPFQGKPACILISVGKGCAVRQRAPGSFNWCRTFMPFRGISPATVRPARRLCCP